MKKYFYCKGCDKHAIVEKKSKAGKYLNAKDSNTLGCDCGGTEWKSWDEGRLSPLSDNERLQISTTAHANYKKRFGLQVYTQKVSDLNISINSVKSGHYKIVDIDPKEDLERFKSDICEKYYQNKLGHVYFCNCGWYGIKKDMKVTTNELKIKEKCCPNCEIDIFQTDGQTYLDYVELEKDLEDW